MSYRFVNDQNRRKARSDEEQEETSNPQGFPFVFQKKKPFHFYERTFTAQHLHFYLSSEIGEPHEYVDMIHKISMAEEQDTVFLHLNTPGGQLDTGVQIINTMRESPAKVVTILEATAHSLGTLIFLAGDEMVVHDNCMIMFHNFRGGVVGKGNELTQELEATVKWFNELAKSLYVPFLTEEEFTRILRGEDVWLHSEGIRARLNKWTKRAAAEQRRKAKAK